MSYPHCSLYYENNSVAYLLHARTVEPQKQPLLSNTHANNITTGLCNPFLGNGSVNTFQRATMEDVSQWTNVIARC
jgi:hypothetical protein